MPLPERFGTVLKLAGEALGTRFDRVRDAFVDVGLGPVQLS